MDILDVDEALKDDSFLFLADKTYDDVSNILQQWKINNSDGIGVPYIAPYSQNQHYDQTSFKLNSKTFTRPKRKYSTIMEAQYSNNIQQNGTPILDLEIGGLVTNMQTSFLQNTSPPASICSSMEQSIDRMNSSLVTSADFANLNFLQSTQSLNFNEETFVYRDVNLSEKPTEDGYTLSDMIRDRKALESLTMSGEGTLIKDSHIAQIDDISLAFSKTASGCSTMDNSTDSMAESNNQSPEIVGNNIRQIAAANSCVPINNEAVSMSKTMVLNNEMIGDITFDFIESSIHDTLNLTNNGTEGQPKSASKANETYKKIGMPLNETALLQNMTYEFEQKPTTPTDATPENLLQMCESTPQTDSVRYQGYNKNKQRYTPSIKMDDVDISPIISLKTMSFALNNTFEKPTTTVTQQIHSETYSERSEVLETIKMPDYIENSNEIFNKPNQQLLADNAAAAAQYDACVQMQCVMDLAEAEVELLAQQGDEEQFDNMLHELSKVEMNAEQVKMQKSLDTLKKRFNYNGNCMANDAVHHTSREAQDMRELTQHMEELLGEDLVAEAHQQLNATIELKENLKHQMRDRNAAQTEIKTHDSPNSSFNNGGTGATLNSSIKSGQSSGERLLSRRSRLYDNVNLSMLSNNNGNDNSNELQAQSGNVSFIVQPKESEKDAKISNETEETETLKAVNNATTNDASCYKLTEKRERHRDRFKTIKINKQRNESGGTELNVPCIDDENYELDVKSEQTIHNTITNHATTTNEQNVIENEEQQQTQQRYSRRDHNTPPPAFNNNNNLEVTKQKDNMNYLTYKKSKDRMNKHSLSVVSKIQESNGSAVATRRLQEPRSLSRPRYISGLQKLGTACKATSAGDLQNNTATLKQMNLSTIGGHAYQQRKVVTNEKTNDLKSPMGIKSKSFHNLSSNFNSGNQNSVGSLRKLSVNSGAVEKPSKFSAQRLASGTQQDMSSDAVFRVPMLVSGLRAPNTQASTGLKRPSFGLTRPSSGYYNVNVVAKTLSAANEHGRNIDADADGQTPTESLSSASSRSSLYNNTITPQYQQQSLKQQSLNTETDSKQKESNITSKLTQVTTGASGIPKPSGLRPPTNVKRSGLPRPSSVVRR